MGVTVATIRTALNTGTGNQDITTTDLDGLTPVGARLFLSLASSDGVAVGGESVMIGFTDGTLSLSLNAWSRHGVGTTVEYHNTTGSPIYLQDPADGSVEVEAAFVSWIANGIRVNITTAPTNALLLTVILYAGTDVSAYVSGFQVTSSGDPLDITAVGFEADLVYLLGAGSHGWPSSGAHYYLSTGVVHNDRASGIVQRSFTKWHRDGRATSDINARFSETYCGMEIQYGVAHGLSLSGFDAQGFTATYTQADWAFWGYLALRFGAGPVADSWVGTHTTPTDTGNDAEAGPSFTPQLVELCGSHLEAVATFTSDATAGPIMLSAFDADDEYATSGCAEDNVGTSNTQSLSDDVAVQVPDDDGSAGLTASFVSFNANGWTLNYTAVKGAAKYFWAVAIEGEAVGVTVTPAPASAVAGRVNPAVVKGSLAVSPAPASAVGAKVDPTVVKGSLVIEPAVASAIGASVDPTVVKGSLALSPTAASAIGAKVDPTVIKGSLTISPAVASAIGASVDPTVVEGGILVTPTPSSAVAAKVDPDVILGSLIISPAAAAAIASGVTPIVVLGSLVVSPIAASAIGGKAEPIVVLGSLILTPSAASAIASTQGPVVVHGSIIVTPNAVSVVATGVDPTVLEGGIEITPEVASAIAAVVAPVVIKGSVTVSPDAATVVAAGVDPTVLGVGVEITPEAASAIAAVLDPTVIQGSIIISPVAVSVVVSSSGPMIYITSLVRTTFVVAWDRTTKVPAWNRITDVPEWDRVTDLEGG